MSSFFKDLKDQLNDAAAIQRAVDAAPAEPTPTADNVARCPKCGSTSLTANKKGYGIGKGVIGAAVLSNPIGLIAGNINSGKVKITCLNCGYQFKPGKK